MLRGLLLTVLLLVTTPTWAATLLSENFDNIAPLSGAGWSLINNSSPLGTTDWFQGNPGVFSAQSGSADSYIAANFENAALGGNISNWLITPELSLNNGDSLSFYTRTESPAFFADRLEVRLSTNGVSTDVGATDVSVGDFTTLLLSVNPSLDPAGYPDAWTQFTLGLSGLGGPTPARLAFRYFVPDTYVNADYIGIDTVLVESAPVAVPEPGTLGLLGTGVAGLMLRGFMHRRHTFTKR